MALRIFIVCILIACMGGTSWARKHKNHDSGDSAGQLTIIEASPMSITVDAGQDVQKTYAVTGDTKATLNGLPVSASDLRAGMVATLAVASDGETILSLAAKDAPRVTKKPVVHHDNVWVNLK